MNANMGEIVKRIGKILGVHVFGIAAPGKVPSQGDPHIHLNERLVYFELMGMQSRLAALPLITARNAPRIKILIYPLKVRKPKELVLVDSEASAAASSAVKEGNGASKQLPAEPETITIDDTLDDVALEVLGVDPSKPQPAKNLVRDELRVRWSNWIINRLGEKLAESLIEKYEAIPELKAQKLNDELRGVLSDKHKKRDSYFVNTQNTAAAALLAIGLVISSLLSDKSIKNRKFMLESLHDAGKIISHLHFGQLNGRKACIMPLVKKNLRHIFENLKSNVYIFGKDLSQEIKKASGEVKSLLFINKDNDLNYQKYNIAKKFHSSRFPFKQNANNKDYKPLRRFGNAKSKFSKAPSNRRFDQQQKR
ncbi:hypothetical protein TKK_0012364 [Trichogramma kaykai]